MPSNANCADSDNPAHVQSIKVSSFIHSVVFNDSASGLGRPWFDCADAQAYLALRCPHIPIVHKLLTKDKHSH